MGLGKISSNILKEGFKILLRGTRMKGFNFIIAIKCSRCNRSAKKWYCFKGNERIIIGCDKCRQETVKFHPRNVSEELSISKCLRVEIIKLKDMLLDLMS